MEFWFIEFDNTFSCKVIETGKFVNFNYNDITFLETEEYSIINRYDNKEYYYIKQYVIVNNRKTYIKFNLKTFCDFHYFYTP